MKTNNRNEYNADFYAWTKHTAKLIRQHRFSEIDLENIAEEIESMGRSERRELINRLAVLLAHLLKWQYQSERRSNSWKYTIEEQREEVIELIEDSPSLKHELNLKLEHAYKKAVLFAATETGIGKERFPKSCPFSFEQCLDNEYLPD